MLHLPALRAGRPYESLSQRPLTDVRSGETIATLSQAATGMIARDLRQTAVYRARLEAVPCAELIARCSDAARRFADDELPLGSADGPRQSPGDYVRQLAATTGMPEAMGRANMAKIVDVLAGMEAVLDGLTRGLDLSVLDHGWGVQRKRRLSYQRLADSLGAVLPNNSPGVHNLWLPAVPLKVPLVLKPGSAEPWTPLRIAQALLAAGCPRETISLYPSDHAGGTEILLRTDRSLFFGDASTVASWQHRDKVQIHGPGWSKVLLGADTAPRFADHLALIEGSITKNGGRSCINASGVWTVSHGRALAEALATRLAAIEARPLDDPDAALAASPDPQVAQRISALIDAQLEQPGAEDLTAALRPGGRVAEVDGCTFLLPTVIFCTDPEHPLTRAEFTFPFATVVEAGEDVLWEKLGPTLVATVLSDDAPFRHRALATRAIDRLNLGPIPTYQISWDQPHEGNLFDHLYQQRAFQATAEASGRTPAAA